LPVAYGCLNASRRACENEVLVARKRLDNKFISALNEKVLDPELLEQVYERTATKEKELFVHVPEELRLEKVELNRAETRVHNFIEFIASGLEAPSRAAGAQLKIFPAKQERPRCGASSRVEAPVHRPGFDPGGACDTRGAEPRRRRATKDIPGEAVAARAARAATMVEAPGIEP
jgi:hypothetical protein